jgi:hypothetical protein
VGITTTPLGYKKPDGNELVKGGDNVIADNAQKSEDIQAPMLARLGQAEAAINAGAGGPGLSADPLNPGLYYFAGPTIAPDTSNPGLYLIGA